MFENPLQVQKPPFDLVQNPSPEQQSDIAGQWRNWMADENNRAALMQFGVSLMQPMGFGQNVAGHVGQAVGSVGEMATRRGEMERRDREADSKAELRASQANLAESRAANAGVSAGRAADRLDMARERLAFDKYRFNTSTLVRLQGAYQRAIEKLNADNNLLPPDQRKPIPTFQDFVRSNPQLAAGIGMGTGGGETEDGAAPAAPASPSRPRPKIGDVIRGFRYKGGDPSSPASWESAT